MYDIANKFIEVYKQQNNIETANIITAQKLEPKLRENILNVLKNRFQEKIELNEVVDDKIIGGSIIGWRINNLIAVFQVHYKN